MWKQDTEPQEIIGRSFQTEKTVFVKEQEKRVIILIQQDH